MATQSRRNRGQSLVEFALITPILLLILMGLFDFGRGVYAYNTLANATRTGVRVAIVDQNPSVVDAKVREAALGLESGSMTVDLSQLTSGCPTVKINCPTSVTAGYTWTPIFPVFKLMWPDGIDLASTTEMPIERVFVSP